MPKNKPNDTNKDESSKSRADSEERKDLFQLTSISQLVKWIDIAVLALQPKYGAIVHELKTGIRHLILSFKLLIITLIKW